MGGSGWVDLLGLVRSILVMAGSNKNLPVHRVGYVVQQKTIHACIQPTSTSSMGLRSLFSPPATVRRPLSRLPRRRCSKSPQRQRRGMEQQHATAANRAKKNDCGGRIVPPNEAMKREARRMGGGKGELKKNGHAIRARPKDARNTRTPWRRKPTITVSISLRVPGMLQGGRKRPKTSYTIHMLQ